jgi:hypothetical protein
VVIQAIPDEGYFPGAAGPFQIASGPDASDMVDLETAQDYVTDESAVVGKITALFQEIHGYARSVTESRTLIMEALQWWQGQQK